MISEIAHFLFLSNLLDKKIYNSKDRSCFGKVIDVIVVPKETYPEVASLVISPGFLRKKQIISWENILPFELPVINLMAKEGATTLPFPESGVLNGNELLLKDTFLDKQILDVYGCKVVRVNDLHLLKENNKIWVVHVDIGFRGISRRLGWEKNLDSIMQWIFTYKLPDQFVSWKYVQQLASGADHVGLTSLKLKTACQPLTTLHPADLSEILMDLNRYERIALFRSLDSKTAGEVLSELKSDVQKRLMENLEREKRYEIINQMPPDKAADVLGSLKPKRREEIMKHMSLDRAEVIKNLLVHPEESAGSIMNTQFVSLAPDLTVEQAINKLKEFAPTVEALYYIYVVDENKTLLGVVTMRRLMASPPTSKLSEVMNTKTIKVKPNTDEERITNIFIKYNFGAIPVVDNQNKMLGIIMFKDAVDKVLSAVVARGK